MTTAKTSTTTLPSNLPADEALDIRKSIRRRLSEARPRSTPTSRYRTAKSRAEIRELVNERKIRPRCIVYADIIRDLPSHGRGQYTMVKDEDMAEWMGGSAKTVQRCREDLAEHGLMDVLTHGEDGKSCLVRLKLREDGLPVIPDDGRNVAPAKRKADKKVHPPQTEKSDESILTDQLDQSKNTPQPPELPAADVAPAAGEEGISGQALVAPEVDTKIEQPPAPCARRRPERKRLGREGAISAKPDRTMFARLWIAAGQIDREGFAWVEWCKLPAGDRTALDDLAKAGKIDTRKTWLGTWLKMRKWERPDDAAPPATQAAAGLGDIGDPLRRRIGADRFASWFGGGKAAIVVDAPDKLVIGVGSDFACNKILQDFGHVIEQIDPQKRRVEVIVKRREG